MQASQARGPCSAELLTHHIHKLFCNVMLVSRSFLHQQGIQQTVRCCVATLHCSLSSGMTIFSPQFTPALLAIAVCNRLLRARYAMCDKAATLCRPLVFRQTSHMGHSKGNRGFCTTIEACHSAARTGKLGWGTLEVCCNTPGACFEVADTEVSGMIALAQYSDKAMGNLAQCRHNASGWLSLFPELMRAPQHTIISVACHMTLSAAQAAHCRPGTFD